MAGGLSCIREMSVATEFPCTSVARISIGVGPNGRLAVAMSSPTQ
jgi:hypothetical protein